MYAQPGKKLLFMGGEFGQWREWAHDTSLDWSLLDRPLHRGAQNWVQTLNRTYREQKALHELDHDSNGFEWVDCNDSAASVVSLLRKGKSPEDMIVVICNFTPVPRIGYRLGVPSGGFWRELLNSDGKEYGGGGVGNMGGTTAREEPMHGRPFSLTLSLPPLGALFLAPEHH
jgi:1,4-alpha-glucan branching enzyme